MGAADLLANLGESRGQVLSVGRDLQGKMQHLSPTSCFVWQSWQALKAMTNFVVFCLDKHFVFSYSEARD